tara:strand:+ start:1061 stop:1690 length:630 start_codon:yes stop_codon:yes gene_type:complete
MVKNRDTIGWSDFALERHVKGAGHSYYDGDSAEVINKVAANWDKRIPGDGESDVSRKVLVPVDPFGFVCPTVDLNKIADRRLGLYMKNEVTRRQEDEDPYVSNFLDTYMVEGFEGTWNKQEQIKFLDEAKFVNIVLYSAEALLENGGERSTDRDWEIVCLIASPVESEPMPPLTLARNFLEKPGGTKSVYTAEQFAESIYYWSQKVRVK